MASHELNEEQMTIAAMKLCELFEIDWEHAKSKPIAAFHVLSALYALPLIEDDEERIRIGNDILKSSWTAYPGPSLNSMSPFHTVVFRHVLTMNTLPHWYDLYRIRPSELVDLYLSIKKAQGYLAWFAIKDPSDIVKGVGLAGAASLIKDGDPRAAGKKIVDRVKAGGDSIVEAAQNTKSPRAATAMKRAGWVGVAVIASASILYSEGNEKLAQIANMIEHMHAMDPQKISDSEYDRAFAGEENRSRGFELKQYWEM